MIAVMPIARYFPGAQAFFVDACEQAGIRYQRVRLLDSFHYGRVMAELWRAGEPFIIIEHDIIATAEGLAELRDCESPWCGFPYLQARGMPVTGLGFTKFEPRRLHTSMLPSFLVEIPWRNVDAVMAAPRLVGFDCHRHEPPAEHLKEIR